MYFSFHFIQIKKNVPTFPEFGLHIYIAFIHLADAFIQSNSQLRRKLYKYQASLYIFNTMS